MTINSQTYLHCAIVRRVDSGKDYRVDASLDPYFWMSPIAGGKLGAPVTKRFILDNFEIVEPSPYAEDKHT